ncbi:MAG: hypothetical protein C3F13_06610 [Anaerolineales bacterium]|nr:MAG: hypothetical protein C3F13_06610 [Anaerolineales bacterium]
MVGDAEVMLLFGNPAGFRPTDVAWDVPENYATACFFGVFENSTAMDDLAGNKERMLYGCEPVTYIT